MKLEPLNIYHIYNRGNNKQLIFIKEINYSFFLNKIDKHLKPYIDVLSYCLMPTHFHFLVYSSDQFNTELFSNHFKIFLSSYTRAINIQEKRTGSLFQQNSKAKRLTYETSASNDCDYGIICFNYIHQNPYAAGLVKKIEDWEYSSFKDYIDIRNRTLCNKTAAFSLLNLPVDVNDLYKARQL